MILLDYKDSRPIYEQVVEKLQELMLLGVLEEDDQMPSVRSLAMELSINPIRYSVPTESWSVRDIFTW